MTGRAVAPATATGLAVVVIALLLLPQVATDFFVQFVMTRVLMLGVVAATIVFLAKLGGMISLGQLLSFGIAGFMYGNASLSEGARGLNLGWNPYASIAFALAVATVVALLLGALASRTEGIYFLMLTLVYGVIGYFVFSQIVTISGPGGVTRIGAPSLFASPLRLYHAGVVLSALTYLGFKLLGRTNFGLALQGVRDDPVRMASLGFNVPLHRTLAFGLGGFVAGLAGLLNVWWNGQIDPASVNIGPTLDVLIIAVVGGISYFEGAWLGALVFVAANTYLRALPLVDRIGITEDRFNTLIGALVLLIMVLNPEGLTGLVDRARRVRRPRPAEPAAAAVASQPSVQSALPAQPARTAGTGDSSPANETKGTVL
ncbi:MAG TPA: branched-chain amino acid ABC transporter permease [Euzebya sp.]|nr:branched-chain amino acid ABC transporter permease [Euzebya sp.]